MIFAENEKMHRSAPHFHAHSPNAGGYTSKRKKRLAKNNQVKK